MDWERLAQLVQLRDSGNVEEAISELARLADKTNDKTGKAIVIMELVNGLRVLGRVHEARRRIRDACELLGKKHNFYPRVAFQDAHLDMYEGSWKSALKKLDTVLREHDTEEGLSISSLVESEATY